MVDHEVDLERAEEIDQVANDISGSVELKVPAIGGDLRYHRGNISLDLLKREFRALEQIKTNATHTGVCVIAHCLVIGVMLDHHDAPGDIAGGFQIVDQARSEEHTSELQSLMRNSYAVFCLTKKKK